MMHPDEDLELQFNAKSSVLPSIFKSKKASNYQSFDDDVKPQKPKAFPRPPPKLKSKKASKDEDVKEG